MMKKSYSICNKCGKEKMFYNFKTKNFECENCDYVITNEDIEKALDSAYKNHVEKQGNLKSINQVEKVVDVKVFRMDDYEWWATKWDLERTHEYYIKEYGLDSEDCLIEDVRECDIDKEGMWWETEDEEDLKMIGDSDEIIGFEVVNGQTKAKVEFGNLMRRSGEVYKFISLREALKEHGDFTEPFCIASTEW